MIAYVSSVVVATAIVAIGGWVSYGSDDGLSRTLRAALSLLLLYTLASPIVTLVGEIGNVSLDDIIDSGSAPDIEDSEYYRVAESAFCDGIRKMVCERYSICEDEVTVRLFDFDFTNMSARKIKIILSGSAVYADSRGIADAVTEAGLGECEVELEIS